MRRLQLNFICLVSVVILSAVNAESPKQKRDLSFVKNIIKSAIFGSEDKTEPPPVVINHEENYRLFRIPGYDNILVKAVPKGTLVPGNVVVPISAEDQVKAGMVASYLGTQTHAETLKALHGVKSLLTSGVLTAMKDAASVPIGPLPPHLQLVAVEGSIEKPHILLETPICDDLHPVEPVVIEQPAFWRGHPLLSVFQRPVPIPSVIEPVHPIYPVELPVPPIPSVITPVHPVKVPISVMPPKYVPELPSKYSYKQIHGDGRVTSYTSNDGHNVLVTDSDHPGPLPPFVTNRVQEVMKSGGHTLYGLAASPVTVGQRPVIQHFHSEKASSYQSSSRPVGTASNYLYKQVHNDGSVTSYSSNQNKANIAVSETAKVPAIPAFITNRIEKVAATAYTGRQPNIGVLSGSNVASSFDIKGMQTSEPQKPEQNYQMTGSSQGSYSYKTVHKDGTVTNHYHEDEGKIFKTPFVTAEVKPISPVFIENRLETIAKTSGGSFSYKIIHSDGSVTDYGVFGVHEGMNGGSRIVPSEKTTNLYQSGQQIKNEGTSAGSFSHKIVHNDGSITSYSNTGVTEENGKVSVATNYDSGSHGIVHVVPNLQLNVNNNQNAGILSQGANGATHHDQMKNDQSSQTIIPAQGSYSYKAVHSDGSMTIYSKDGVKEIDGQQINRGDIEQHKYEKVSASNTIGQTVSPNIQVNAGSGPGSFSNKAVHTDGSVTTYSQNRVEAEKKSTIKNAGNEEIKSLKSNDRSHDSSATNVQDKTKASSGSFSYKTVHSVGSVTNFGQGAQDVKAPSNSAGAASSSFSFNGANIDQSSLAYSQNGGNMQSSLSAAENQDKTKASSGSFSYKTVHSDGSVTNYPGQSENLAQNSHNQPSSSFSYKTVQSDGSVTHNMNSGSLPQNVEATYAAVDASKSNYGHAVEVIPSAPELPEGNLAVSPVGILVADSEKVLLSKPLVSTYSYKQISHNHPNQVAVAVNAEEASKESQFKVSGHVASINQINEADAVDTIPKDYVYIPPATTNEPPPIKTPVLEEKVNIGTYNPPSAIVLAPVVEVPCDDDSLSQHPIVVLEEPMQYSYQHIKVDGSAMLVESDQSVVSVNITPKKEQIKNRGDIP